MGKWVGQFDVKHLDKLGNLIHEEVCFNTLADEGEQMMLDVFLRGATQPTNFYIRLFNDTPVETDTIALLTGEPVGNGYAAEVLAASAVGWPTLALDSGDYMATSAAVTFLSTGTIGPVSYMVLATSTDSSGKLISFAALSTPRTLADGESLQITYTVKLQ